VEEKDTPLSSRLRESDKESEKKKERKKGVKKRTTLNFHNSPSPRFCQKAVEKNEEKEEKKGEEKGRKPSTFSSFPV